MTTCTAAAPHALALEKNEHQLSQVALLPAEGIGVHGNFFIRVATRLTGAYLYVSARGYTPAMEMLEYRSAFRFYGNVKLLHNGRQVVKKQLERESEELWPDDRYVPIGSAVMCVPVTKTGALSIEVEAGYEFNGGTGFVTPIPPTGKLAIPFQGRK